MIKEPTRVTCDSSSLIDHILSNVAEKISASGIIDIGVSDHQLTFCTRKVLKAKSNCHQNILARSFKKYDPQKFIDALGKINFSNYELFADIDVVYADFLTKLTETIHSIAPFQEMRIHTNSQEWFVANIREKIKTRVRLLKNFKKTKSRVDEDIYKSAQCEVRKIIKQKKRDF